MRTFVVFALLALAVSAFDIEAYTQGFSQQMGFSVEQVQDGYTCFAAVSQVIHNVKTQVKALNLNGVIVAVQQAKDQLLTACGPYVMDYKNYAMENSNGRRVQNIIEQFFPELVQQVAMWANYLVAGQDMEAGQTEAFILQILMGAQEPTVLPEPALDWSKYQPINQDALFQEYLGSFFDTLGLLEKVDMTNFKPCTVAIEGLVMNFGHTEAAWRSGDFDGKLDAVENFVGELIQVAKECKGTIKAEGLLIVPIFKAFARDPVHFLLTVLDNSALNFPQLIQSFNQERMDLMEGEYTAAGVSKAQTMMTIFNGIVNFAN